MVVFHPSLFIISCWQEFQTRSNSRDILQMDKSLSIKRWLSPPSSHKEPFRREFRTPKDSICKFQMTKFPLSYSVSLRTETFTSRFHETSLCVRPSKQIRSTYQDVCECRCVCVCVDRTCTQTKEIWKMLKVNFSILLPFGLRLIPKVCKIV